MGGNTYTDVAGYVFDQNTYDEVQTVVDGWFGQFAMGGLFSVAQAIGYQPDQEDKETFNREISAFASLSREDDEPEFHSEYVSDLADRVETWINDYRVAEGFSAGWWEGSFMVFRLCDADDERECELEDCWHSS